MSGTMSGEEKKTFIVSISPEPRNLKRLKNYLFLNELKLIVLLSAKENSVLFHRMDRICKGWVTHIC